MATEEGIIETAPAGPGGPADLLPLVYEELRRLAEHYLRGEPAGQTLQPTALVHEAWLRLAGRGGDSWGNRAQFFSVAARAMRHLLIDHARRRRAAKRGGDHRPVPLDGADAPAAKRDDDLIALDEALGDLATLDPELARVVELRFFGGLSVQETATVIGVAPITVKRTWRMARGWLQRRIAGDP